MPKVNQPWRGENKNPTLQLLKVERDILENAAGLCEAMAKNVEGFNAEMAKECRDTAARLTRMAVKDTDLTKPF